MSAQTTPTLEEVVDEIHHKLLAWEVEIERTKSPKSDYITRLGNNGMAALLYHSAALQMGRLGSYLLKESLTNRRDGMLFGLTRRPMIESYTRALWLEFVVDDERAKQLMTRDKSAYNILSGEKGFPPLNQIWESLQKAAALAVMQNTIEWLQKKRTWWNDSAHIGPNALYMGWSNEYADVFLDNQRVVGDLHTLLEISSQSAGRFYVLHSVGDDGDKTAQIHREGEQLRAQLASLGI